MTRKPQTIQTDRQTDRQFVNFIRGIAVFLMLWGHSIQYCSQGSFDFFENWAFKAIYSFHMPLFMLISGYLFWFSFKKRNMKELLIHKSQTLLQPMILYPAFETILRIIVCFILTGNGIGDFFRDEVFGSKLGSLWFLCSVLAASVAVAIGGKLTDRNWLRMVIVLFGVIIVAMFPNKVFNIYMYPYFLIGFFFAKYKEQIPTLLLKLRYLTLVVFPAILPCYKKEHYIYTTGVHFLQYNDINALSIDIFRWMIGLIGSIFIITIALIIFRRFGNQDKKQVLFDFFESMGGYSLQLYCLQRTFLEHCLPIGYGFLISHYLNSNILAENIVLYNLVYTPLIAVGYSVVLLFVIRLLKKTKVPGVIFGR